VPAALPALVPPRQQHLHRARLLRTVRRAHWRRVMVLAVWMHGFRISSGTSITHRCRWSRACSMLHAATRHWPADARRATELARCSGTTERRCACRSCTRRAAARTGATSTLRTTSCRARLAMRSMTSVRPCACLRNLLGPCRLAHRQQGKRLQLACHVPSGPRACVQLAVRALQAACTRAPALCEHVYQPSGRRAPVQTPQTSIC
jgi:hypothetical protein